MKCKKCKNEIPDGSIFCLYCGEKQIKEKKAANVMKIPAPKQLPSGAWRGRIQIDGKRVSITRATEEEYYRDGYAMLKGEATAPAKETKTTLKECMDAYINKRSAILSPSTIRGYKIIARTRFKPYHNIDIKEIDWQTMINDEASKNVSAKTIKGAWGLVKSALKDQGIEANVDKPHVVKRDLPWLDYDQITKFLEKIKDTEAEVPALLGLHGLRLSEILATTPDKISDGVIHVRGSVVRSEEGYVAKETNKNDSSVRDVPIVIPRLKEIVDQCDRSKLFDVCPTNIYNDINDACEAAGVPKVGVHGLRRSFASLCYHLGLSELETMRLGGWSDYQTMRRIYTKLSDSDYNGAIDKLKEHFGMEVDAS